LLTVAQGIANFAYAMRKRFIGNDHVRPDRLDQLVLGHKTLGILDKIKQDFKALWA
jgi:hypothetical protein